MHHYIGLQEVIVGEVYGNELGIASSSPHRLSSVILYGRDHYTALTSDMAQMDNSWTWIDDGSSQSFGT